MTRLQMRMGKILAPLLLWPLMLVGFAINSLLLREIIRLSIPTGSWATQRDFGLYYFAAITGLPIFLVSGLVILGIYLSQKEGYTFGSALKYGYGLGWMALLNCIFSLIVFALATG